MDRGLVCCNEGDALVICGERGPRPKGKLSIYWSVHVATLTYKDEACKQRK